MTPTESHVSVRLVEGVEGSSVYIADYRVCGPKPWGGGHVLHEWRAERADLLRALGIESADEQYDVHDLPSVWSDQRQHEFSRECWCDPDTTPRTGGPGLIVSHAGDDEITP